MQGIVLFMRISINYEEYENSKILYFISYRRFFLILCSLCTKAVLLYKYAFNKIAKGTRKKGEERVKGENIKNSNWKKILSYSRCFFSTA